MDENTILKISQLVVDVVFAVSLAFIISYTFFAQVLQQGFSMAPYINDRSVVLTNRLYRNVLPLNRNDVIAFYVNGQESIKRIYGMPGETITISNGNLYVNDIQLENEDLKNSLSSNIDQNVKLGEDEYYVLGDNLDSSKDSRASDVGNISKKNIIGKVWFIVR
ncbi:MAG: signal peptidase I [Lachnospiraceae bacterium]|nr:signal peptidase I [Lachnospiraceae bacterium]